LQRRIVIDDLDDRNGRTKKSKKGRLIGALLYAGRDTASVPASLGANTPFWRIRRRITLKLTRIKAAPFPPANVTFAGGAES
jgi:hypothetical protein